MFDLLDKDTILKLSIAVMSVAGLILAALIQQLSSIHIKECRRNKEELRLYRELEEGYIQLLIDMSAEDDEESMTMLAAKRRFRKILRSKGYDTPGYKNT